MGCGIGRLVGEANQMAVSLWVPYCYDFSLKDE